MVYGNIQAQATLHNFFQQFASGKTSFPFLLLTWRAHVGKTTIVEHCIRDLLGDYIANDYVALYDFSEELGKEQSLKVEVDRADSVVEINGVAYHQWWMREINQRLSLAPVGSWKVLYLQNIERMTSAAANALLKSFEEPLPGRLIVASTTDSEQLLDTIRSRALLIRFDSIAKEQWMQILSEQYPNLTVAEKTFILAFSLGAWGIVSRLSQDQELTLWVEQFQATQDWFLHPSRIDEQIHRIQRFSEQWSLQQLLDALLYLWSGDATKQSLIDTMIRVKQLLETNVQEDHIVFWWLMTVAWSVMKH